MDMSFSKNIEAATERNNNYRNVLYTNKYQQLVTMSLAIGDEIPMESHNGSQFIRVESGNGVAYIGKKRVLLSEGVAIIIPPNAKHVIKNTSKVAPLKVYTVYSPPQHKPNTVQKNK
jgi:mannose-6-phosphate isomerase-like protein (cupin superfamily)